ncbi:MAG: hypothetical protein M9887_10025 [Chitinophagales bacterium]|nr:hypothetical protein [Chitinophagales bacterium]
MEFGIGTRLIHPKYQEGVIIGVEENHYEIYFKDYGEKEISKNFENFVVVKLVDHPDDAVSLDKVEKIIKNLIRPLTDPSEEIYLGEKWKGGEMILQPENRELQAKSFSIETFFHKIVMVRDRLRVMEQRINSSSNLSDEEKVDLQQYITRIYGSLTSFNVLFRFKEDQFKGTGKD